MIRVKRSLRDREASLEAQSAGVATVEADISLFSPCGAVTVLQSPAIVVHADQQQCGVEVGAAVRKQTASVELEVGAIDGHGQWLGGQKVSEAVTVSDVSVAVELLERAA